MYRYLLFHCRSDYPFGGGMCDCEFKTNNFDELIPFIEEHYKDLEYGHIHYYDTVEDKMKYAIMEIQNGAPGHLIRKFVGWSEKRM